MLRTLLLTIGVTPPEVPSDPEARAALWQGKTAEKRILLLLDDAMDSEQVTPLLPGASGTAVIVTSRRRLVGLSDALAFSLQTLSDGEAQDLLLRISGRSSEGAATSDLVRLCGYLPLAISLTAAQLKHHESWTATDLAGEFSCRGIALVPCMARSMVAAAFDLSSRPNRRSAEAVSSIGSTSRRRLRCICSS